MYTVRTKGDTKFLVVDKNCRRVFTTGGNLIKLDSDGIAELPADAKIAACKINHWEQHNIRIAKTRQSLHYDAIIEKYGLGQHIGVDEEEILLASLEVLETL